MNYLAHLAFSYPDPDLMLGNFIADGLKKQEEQHWSARVNRGVKMHRDIDFFTDQHESSRWMKDQFYSTIGKYHSVAVDIVLDYYLMQQWTQLFDFTFIQLQETIESVLEEHKSNMNPRHSRLAASLIRYKWLNHFKTWEGLSEVLGRMNQRAKFVVNFNDVIPVLKSNHSEFYKRSFAFFNEIQTQPLIYDYKN